MKKFRVTGVIPVFVVVELEAENAEQAIESAIEDHLYLDSYCGNGGTNKLVGVAESNMSVYPGEVLVESDDFKVEVEEI